MRLDERNRGRRAGTHRAVLCCAVLRCATLFLAVLCCAVLRPRSVQAPSQPRLTAPHPSACPPTCSEATATRAATGLPP